MECIRCRTKFNYAREGSAREVINQARPLFVIAERDDNDYAGREAAARAKSMSRRSNGVFGGVWREAHNQAKWRDRWGDSVYCGKRSEELVELL